MSNSTRISPVVLERVDAGFEWLDENLPDWRTVVNFDILDMAWEETCILGQYNNAKYGDSDFTHAMRAYFQGPSDDRVVQLGFLALDLDYTELNRAWKVKLRKLGMLSGNDA